MLPRQIAAAIAASLADAGYSTIASPWYFPSLGEYASLLEQHGLEPTPAAPIDQPTPLHDPEAGLQNWLRMFANPYFVGLATAEGDRLCADIEQRLRPTLYREGRWFADYRRLRIAAVRRA